MDTSCFGVVKESDLPEDQRRPATKAEEPPAKKPPKPQPKRLPKVRRTRVPLGPLLGLALKERYERNRE